MKLKNIFFKNDCLNKNRNRASSLSNKDNNFISSLTTINNRNTLKQANQNGLTYNRINMSNSRCKVNQSEQNSFKIANRKNSTKNKRIVKEFKKKIIFERSNNFQSKQAEILSNSFVPPLVGEKKLNCWIEMNNPNKKKIVFSFNSPNKYETNNLQSNQVISNSMLSLSSKSNSKTKYSILRSTKTDNVIIHYNTNNNYIKKSIQKQTSKNESPTSTKPLLALSPPHLPCSHSFNIQNTEMPNIENFGQY